MATGLLVSVRSAEEAARALAGGADVIDVKEPSQGPLGRPAAATLAAVAAVVAGVRPLSVALGELQDVAGAGDLGLQAARETLAAAAPPVGWAKVGLSGMGALGWRDAYATLAQALAPTPLVPAVYADAERAEGPEPLNALPELVRRGAKQLLLDTFVKDGRGLLEWQSLPALRELARRCQEAGVALALAGALGAADFAALLPLKPMLLAVRGAACGGGMRHAEVDAARVRRLTEALARSTPSAATSQG